MLKIDDIDFTNKSMNPEDVDYVIYHGRCTDGFTSAMIVNYYFKVNKIEKQISYHSGVFNVLPPLDDIKGKNVLICDFSYKKHDLQKLLSLVKNLLILDHHKTAEQDLKDLPDSNKIFRMDHAAAYITWRYFFRNEPVPLGVLLVEDNDIWTKKMDNTYEFTAFAFTLPFIFEAYERILDDNYIKTEAIIQGAGMVKQNNSIISNALKYACPKFVEISGKYYFVSYLNSTILKSELGNRAFNEYPNINFSAIYSHNDYQNNTTFSLRSLDTSTDVSGIAKIYNGGGHRSASGVQVNYITNILPGTVIDNHKTYFLLSNIYDGTTIIDGILYYIIYMNTSNYKNKLAKYLLQTRYITKDNIAIQECVSILKNRKTNPLNPYKYNDHYDISAIWNYDGERNCTWFTVCYCDSSIKDKLINKLKDLKNYEQKDDKFIFTVDGCVNDLNQIKPITTAIKTY